jgi:hypothetical protein
VEIGWNLWGFLPQSYFENAYRAGDGDWVNISLSEKTLQLLAGNASRNFSALDFSTALDASAIRRSRAARSLS